ncbi:hypothetical protein TNCV_4937901 [Trichonephila clavipes]|nr:hypothetical protein TNCV_4937901 [Trichonephila clavipes]
MRRKRTKIFGKFLKPTLNDNKELHSLLRKTSARKQTNYDDSSIVEHMTLMKPTHYQKVRQAEDFDTSGQNGSPNDATINAANTGIADLKTEKKPEHRMESRIRYTAENWSNVQIPSKRVVLRQPHQRGHDEIQWKANSPNTKSAEAFIQQESDI